MAIIRPRGPFRGALGEGTGKRRRQRREVVEKSWGEAMEMLEKEPSARNSPEKPKDRDRVSLLPGRGSKRCLSHEGAVLGRNSAFSTARSRLQDGGAAWTAAATEPARLCPGVPSPGAPTRDQATPNLSLAPLAPSSDQILGLSSILTRFCMNFPHFPSVPLDSSPRHWHPKALAMSLH